MVITNDCCGCCILQVRVTPQFTGQDNWLLVTLATVTVEAELMKEEVPHHGFINKYMVK